MAEGRIDWGSARVIPKTGRHMTLRVKVTTGPGWWDEHFSTAVSARSEEVRSRGWGSITLMEDEIEVDRVLKGSETELQEFLEACVRHANNETARERFKGAEVAAEHDRDAERRHDTAEIMTERFRTPPSPGE